MREKPVTVTTTMLDANTVIANSASLNAEKLATDLKYKALENASAPNHNGTVPFDELLNLFPREADLPEYEKLAANGKQFSLAPLPKNQPSGNDPLLRFISGAGEGILRGLFEPSLEIADILTAGYNAYNGTDYPMNSMLGKRAAQGAGTGELLLDVGKNTASMFPLIGVPRATYNGTEALLNGDIEGAGANSAAVAFGFGVAASRGYGRTNIEFIPLENTQGPYALQRGSIGGFRLTPADNEIVPGGGLQAHEDAGGHLLEKHVGQTEAMLLDRMTKEPNIPGSSSFYDQATAESAVARTLKANQEKINDWLGGANKRDLPIEHTVPENIGITIPKGSMNAVDTNNLLLILRRDSSMSNGYRIQTGYPTK
jgi:Bacterial CdiA-CT RNAse A domain